MRTACGERASDQLRLVELNLSSYPSGMHPSRGSALGRVRVCIERRELHTLSTLSGGIT